VNLTANDSDPENNVPLVLVSIAYVGGDTTASASVVSSSSVQVNADWKGSSSFTYTVRDSLNATSTGSLTVTATGSNAYCQSNVR
jgi:hypothetical protein